MYQRAGAQWGPDIVGAAYDPVQSALASVMRTPQFQQLVQQHARGVLSGMAQQPHSMAGPGVAYGGQSQVVEREARDVREHALGFKQTAIASSGSNNVTSRPQVIFRGERLVVPDTLASSGGSTIADAFEISDIKIGNRSQLVEAVNIPAKAFLETAVGVRLALDTAQIAQDVVIAVVNNDSQAGTFKAVIFGTAIF